MKILELKTLGQFLYRTKCTWENQGGKTMQSLDEEEEEGVVEM
jgi:hypothetical protein